MSAGPAAAPPATTATTPALASIEPTPAEAAPPASSATGAASGSDRASQLARGRGVSDVTAARSEMRAR